MNKKKKIVLAIVIVVLLAAVVGFSLNQTQKNVVAVQTAKVARQDIASIVTASGEIKPKTYVNVGANAFGRITKLFVQEGQHVKKGQMVAQLENVQPAVPQLPDLSGQLIDQVAVVGHEQQRAVESLQSLLQDLLSRNI